MKVFASVDPNGHTTVTSSISLNGASLYKNIALVARRINRTELSFFENRKALELCSLYM